MESELIRAELFSEAWLGCSERRYNDENERKIDGSTLTQASSSRPWARFFPITISAWLNRTSSKLKKSEAKFNQKTRKQRQLLSESGFILRIVPPSLSRYRRIKMKPINQVETFNRFISG